MSFAQVSSSLMLVVPLLFTKRHLPLKEKVRNMPEDKIWDYRRKLGSTCLPAAEYPAIYAVPPFQEGKKVSNQKVD